MPVQAFTSAKPNSPILRVYTLRLSYQYCRQLDKDKSISSNLASHCIIIRQSPTMNKTDFGYRQQLKTNILKKMHFVYLEKLRDLFVFLYQHVRYLQQHIYKPQSKGGEKIEQTAKASPLFGMLIVQNIESYFGEIFSYETMGANFFLFLKYMKLLQNLMPFNSNICFTYSYNPEIFNYGDFLTYLKSEDITCWKVGSKKLEKNGYSYESEWTRKFYEIYEIEEDAGQEDREQADKHPLQRSHITIQGTQTQDLVGIKKTQ